MTLQERELLIERYGAGTLSPSEKEMLEGMAARDPELADQLQAERIIRNAAGHDAASIPLLPDDPSARLLSLLASTPPAMMAGGAASSSIFAPLGVKIAIVAAAIVGLVVGVFLIAPWPERLSPPASPSSLRQGASKDLPGPPEQTSVSPSATSRSGRIDEPATASGVASQSDAASAAIPPKAGSGREKFPTKPLRVKKSSGVPTDNAEARTAEEPVVFTTDSVRATVRIDRGSGR
jgi:hypothetical protein